MRCPSLRPGIRQERPHPAAGLIIPSGSIGDQALPFERNFYLKKNAKLGLSVPGPLFL
jgi:hypothetical protein